MYEVYEHSYNTEFTDSGKVTILLSGADPGFSLGGGGQKIMCANAAHYEREARSPFWQGSRALLRALKALRAVEF